MRDSLKFISEGETVDMGDERKKIEYLYPVEELDKLIDQINEGLTPAGLNDQIVVELKLRMKERLSEICDEDGLEEGDEDLISHERLKEHIKKEIHTTAKEDVMVITLNEKQKAKIREEMEVSIVRENPNLTYHIPDDKLYSSEEKREIETKLSRLGNCYYTQANYVNAVNIIKSAIEWSLKHDYPWMKYEDAVKQFNEGKIFYAFGNLPKLYTNYTTQVTDPEILKGIVNGDIELKDQNEVEEKKKYSNTPSDYKYTIITGNAYQYYAEMHRRGFDTLLSPIFNRKTNKYDRFALPANNRFCVRTKREDRNPELENFDWLQPEAGKRYNDLMHGKKYTTTDLIRDLNELNQGKLQNVLAQKFTDYRQMLVSPAQQYGTQQTYQQTLAERKPETIALEQNIITAIRQSNPNK
jgi:vacuolar-type H+-ATPase subunit F/Vma7